MMKKLFIQIFIISTIISTFLDTQCFTEARTNNKLKTHKNSNKKNTENEVCKLTTTDFFGKGWSEETGTLGMNDKAFNGGDNETRENCDTSNQNTEELKQRNKKRCNYLKFIDRKHDDERCVGETPHINKFPHWCFGKNCIKPDEYVESFKRRAQEEDEETIGGGTTVGGTLEKKLKSPKVQKTLQNKIRDAARKEGKNRLAAANTNLFLEVSKERKETIPEDHFETIPEDPFDRIDKLLLQQLDSEKLGDNECYNAGIKFKKKLKKNNNCLIIEKGKNSTIVTFANYIKNNVISSPWKKKYRQIENILKMLKPFAIPFIQKKLENKTGCGDKAKAEAADNFLKLVLDFAKLFVQYDDVYKFWKGYNADPGKYDFPKLYDQKQIEKINIITFIDEALKFFKYAESDVMNGDESIFYVWKKHYLRGQVPDGQDSTTTKIKWKKMSVEQQNTFKKLKQSYKSYMGIEKLSPDMCFSCNLIKAIFTPKYELIPKNIMELLIKNIFEFQKLLKDFMSNKSVTSSEVSSIDKNISDNALKNSLKQFEFIYHNIVSFLFVLFKSTNTKMGKEKRGNDYFTFIMKDKYKEYNNGTAFDAEYLKNTNSILDTILNMGGNQMFKDTCEMALFKTTFQYVLSGKFLLLDAYPYKNCVKFESKKNYQYAAESCPNDVLLPTPNTFEYKTYQEQFKKAWMWSIEAFGFDKGNQESISFKSPLMAQMFGFQCNKPCKNCYGNNNGYPFPHVKGYTLDFIPKTSVYGVKKKTEEDIPWIREENWDPETAMYYPRCECEHGYKGNETCTGKTYNKGDITMVCEMVKPNGGILDGCFEGHFVVSAKSKDGTSKCFVLQMNLENACFDWHEKGLDMSNNTKIPNLAFSNNQCLLKNLGAIGKQKTYIAERPAPNLVELKNTKLACPDDFSDRIKNTNYCKKTRLSPFIRAEDKRKSLDEKYGKDKMKCKDAFDSEDSDVSSSKRRRRLMRTSQATC